MKASREARPSNRARQLRAAACVLLALLAVGALVTVRRSERQELSAHRFLHGEAALHLARAALAEAGWFLAARELIVPGEEAADQLLKLPADQIGWFREIALPSRERLLAGLPGEASVSVTARLSGFRPLRADAQCGVLGDAVEKRGSLLLVAEAACGLATRRLTVERTVTVVHVVPPVVGRFVLFCRGQPPLPEEQLNCLSYDAGKSAFTTGDPPRPASPFVVRGAPVGGPGFFPGAAPSGGLLSLIPDASVAGDLFRHVGWTYLGGPAPWILNLTFGPGIGNPLEEGLLLRRTAFVAQSKALPGCQEESHLLGFAKGLMDSPLFPAQERGPGSRARRLPEGTAVLHLAGDALHVTPPVVLGRVYRRYLRYIKLRRDQTQPFEAFPALPDSEAFDALGGRFAALTGQGWDEYQRLMPQAVVEPYMRSYDHLVTSREQSAARRPTFILPGDTPGYPAAQLTAERVEDLVRPMGVNRPYFLYPAPETSADGSGAPPATSVTLLRPQGPGGSSQPVFKGDLGSLERYGELMLARRTSELAQGTPREGLERFLARRNGRLELAVPGVVYLGRGDLELPRLYVRRGGQLIVEGNVTIAGGIETAPGEPLTLVSLSGDLRIATPERVRAALIAPNGRLRLTSGGDVELFGSVMVGSLDNLPTDCAGTGSHRLTWDPQLDSFDPEVLSHGYRVVLGAPRQLRSE